MVGQLAIPISNSIERPTDWPRIHEITLARYDERGEILLICRELTEMHGNGFQRKIILWYNFEDYEEQQGLDNRESVCCEVAWNCSGDEGSDDAGANQCYDGNAWDWRNRRLDKAKTIDLWSRPSRV
ncbi:hypothetical protein BFW01_g1675 [Lasiodiplodia theobromae]|nr:hypothetical protein BFW01_g1675 [Lasiodiplodia theobromae]